MRQSADCLDPFEGDLELPTGDAERDAEEPRIRARVRCTRSEVDASVNEAVEQGDLVVCLFPSGFPSLLEPAIVRNGFEVFSEIDEDKVARVGRRVGEVARSEPRSYVGVGAGERAPILGEVRRQVLRGQEGGPENILPAKRGEFCSAGYARTDTESPKTSRVRRTDGDPILIGLALEAMADRSLSLC